MRRLIPLLVVGCTSTLTGSYGAITNVANGMVHAGAPAEVPPPYGIEKIEAGGSFAYAIPTGDGRVVLVDSGFEEDAHRIKKALAGRPIAAIFLTHAHIDHTAGAATLGKGVPVYIGAADCDLAQGKAHFTSLFVHVPQHILGQPPMPKTLTPLEDGEHIAIGNITIEALGLPGHSPGSMAFLLGDVAFTGDAIVNPTGFALAPSPGSTEDRPAAWRSFRKLARTGGIHILYDAHYGRTDNAYRMLRAALEKNR